MSAQPMLTKSESATEISGWLQLPNEARKLLQYGQSPKDYAQTLLASGHYLAAIDFLAHAMPARDGIWWGCLCLQHTFGDKLRPLDRAAAIVTVRWVMRPFEENRVETRAIAAAAGTSSSAGALAAAVFYSGGSVAPKGQPFQPPEPYAHSRAISFAIRLLLGHCKQDALAATQRQYVELGMSLVDWLPQETK